MVIFLYFQVFHNSLHECYNSMTQSGSYAMRFLHTFVEYCYSHWFSLLLPYLRCIPVCLWTGQEFCTISASHSFEAQLLTRLWHSVMTEVSVFNTVACTDVYPSPPVDVIWAMMIVWRISEKINENCSVLCSGGLILCRALGTNRDAGPFITSLFYHHITTVLRPFSRTTRVSQCQKRTSGL